MRRMSGSGLLIAVVAVFLFAGRAALCSATESDLYRYKFPCAPGQDCWYTQGPHVNNALDFQIGDPSAHEQVLAMSEGTVYTFWNDAGCTDGSGGLGNYIVLSDVFGRSTVYAHFSIGFFVGNGSTVRQGDPLGWEGNSGNSSGCAIHLHWEPGGSLPNYIDGNLRSGFCTPYCILPSSTNSMVGYASGYTWLGPITSGLRNAYSRNGGWDGVGWTSSPYWIAWEQLSASAPNDKAWVQHVRHDESILYSGMDGAIYVAQKCSGSTCFENTDGAYLPHWLYPMWMQTANKKAGFPTSDMTAANCVGSDITNCAVAQHFQFGGAWVDIYSGLHFSPLCPDLTGDNRITMADITQLARHWGATAGGEGYNSGADPNFDGKTSMADATKLAVRWGQRWPCSTVY